MRLFLFLLGLFLFNRSYNAYGQDFSTHIDKALNKTTIKYYLPEAGIVIQKTVSNSDTINLIYEIGLVIFNKSVSSDDFMGPKTILEFQDGSHIIFQEQATFNYLYAGKHELCIRHVLNQDEFYQLKSKKIASFRILTYRKSLDKFQMEKILNAFKKIETEKPSN